MINKNLKLKLISKFDFGRRSFSPKEFSLLWRMIIDHFTNVNEVENFHWKDTIKLIKYKITYKIK